MEKQSYLADIRFALKQIMGYDRLYVFFQVLLSFMEGLQPLIMIYFPRMIVDAVVEKAEISRIIGIILLMAGIGILYAVLHSAIRFAYMVVKKDMYKNYIMLGISGKIAEMDAELLDDPETHSKCQAAESAASRDLIFGSTERFFSFYVGYSYSAFRYHGDWKAGFRTDIASQCGGACGLFLGAGSAEI